METKKKVLSIISMVLITLATIGFSSMPLYDSKIDYKNEFKEETLFNQSSANRYISRALSNKTEANIILDHIDILEKLNASEQLIGEKKLLILKKLREAANSTINAALFSGEIQKEQEIAAVTRLRPLSSYKDIITIHDSYLKKARKGTVNYVNSIINIKEEIKNLRENKTFYWRLSIISNSIGVILAIFSSCFLKENKNNRKE